MLEQRLITGVVGGSIALTAMLWAPMWALAALIALVALAAAREWSALAGLHDRVHRSLYLGLVSLLTIALAAATLIGPELPMILVFVASLLWWLRVVVRIPRVRPVADMAGVRPGWLALGLLLFPAMMVALLWIATWPDYGRWFLVYAVCLVWVADTGAYFAGRAFGRRKLAPAISVGKTVAGFWGGLLAVALYAIVCGLLFGLSLVVFPGWIALAVTAAGLSVVGDLWESVLKREAGAKDSGTLLPGHGGVLDRIDSLLAAAPVMALGMASLLFGGAPA